MVCSNNSSDVGVRPVSSLSVLGSLPHFFFNPHSLCALATSQCVLNPIAVFGFQDWATPALWLLAFVVPSTDLAAKSLSVHFQFPGQQHHLLGLTESLCHRVEEASLKSARVLRQISKWQEGALLLTLVLLSLGTYKNSLKKKYHFKTRTKELLLFSFKMLF